MKAVISRIFYTVLLIVIAIQVWILVSLFWWRTAPVETTMFMRIATWSNPDLEIRHEWISYPNMGKNIKKAVIAAEDAKFVDHHGFDWDGVQVALAKNEKNGNVIAGGSTISQQLAKNLFLYNKRSYLRKAEEAIITVMMEKMWSKQRILEVYLNSVEFGEGIYGIEAASQYYFNRSSEYLSPQQAIFLAALLPNPKYYQDNRDDEKFRFKQRFIAKYMRLSHIP